MLETFTPISNLDRYIYFVFMVTNIKEKNSYENTCINANVRVNSKVGL